MGKAKDQPFLLAVHSGRSHGDKGATKRPDIPRIEPPGSFRDPAMLEQFRRQRSEGDDTPCDQDT